MTRSDLVEKITDFIGPSENVSGEVAEGLQLLRLAAAELSRPDAASGWNDDAVKQALSDRDTQVEAQDALISAILSAMGMGWDDIDDLAIRIAQGRKDLEKLVRIVTLAGTAAGLKYNSLEDVPDNALESAILTLRQNTALSSVKLSSDDHIEPDSFIPDDIPGLLSAWIHDAIDLAHAVHGNLAPENRVLAKFAAQLILLAPRGDHHGE